MRYWGAVVMVAAAIGLSGCATTEIETSPAGDAPATEETTPTERDSVPTPSPAPEAEEESEEETSPLAEKPEDEPGDACSGEVEGPGSECHAEDEKFCEENSCIPNFSNGNGTVVECVDGEYSHSGGISGACSDHGGENE